MDRELMAKLYQVTGDDDQRAPEDVMRAIVKASVRAKEPAMRDMATWLGKRLATDHCGAKVKVLRLIIMVISHPKGGKWADAFNSTEAIEQVRAAAVFSCAPDPIHGEKPAEFVRASAAKALDLLQAGQPAAAKTPPGSPAPSPAPRGGSRSPTTPAPTGGKPASPTVAPSPVSKDFGQAIQIDLEGRNTMKLPLGGAMEEELETRQKKVYVYDVKVADKAVDFEFAVLSGGELPIGVFYTRAGGDVSYPLEGWATAKRSEKAGTQRGCCEIEAEGSIALVLDNSGSRMKTRTVKFAVQSRATTEQYEVNKKLAEMQAAQERRAVAAREEKLGLQRAGSPVGGPAPAPAPAKPKPTRAKPTSAAAAAAAYEAAEAEADAAALFEGHGSTSSAGSPRDGTPGSPGGGIKRAGRRRKTAGAARSSVAASAPIESLDFMADAEAAAREQAAQAAATRKAKQAEKERAKKDRQKEEAKQRAAAKAQARQAAKARAAEDQQRQAKEAERDRKEEIKFQKQREAAAQARQAREEMEAAEAAALEKARAAAEERRQAQAQARENVERQKAEAKAERLRVAEAARREAAEKKEAEAAARAALKKKRDEEEAMKIEMYDTDGRVLRRLGRYTVQEENGYLRKWACDVCLQLKAGTFYWDSTEEDPFRACARCLVDGDVIDLTEDLEFGAAGAAVGDVKAADAEDSDEEPRDPAAMPPDVAKKVAAARAVFAAEKTDPAELAKTSMSAVRAEEHERAEGPADTETLMTVYIRPGRWEGGGIGDGGKWVQDERFAVKVPRSATWAELVTAVAASDEAAAYTVTGGELDGAAEVPLDAAHPELAAINFFTGKTRKRIVSAMEYKNFPVPFPGQKADSAGTYGVLTRSQVIAGDAAMGEVGLKQRAEVQLQLPTVGAAPPNPTRVTLHEESVLISDTKTMDGTHYYQVSWSDKRGRSHVVWKRYSRFLDLRSELSEKVPPVHDIPFPKKKRKKKKEKVVEERRVMLQAWLQTLMLGEEPIVSPVLYEDVGKTLYTFLTGESDLR